MADSLLKALQTWSQWGTTPENDKGVNRHIIICNRISLTFTLLALFVVGVAIFFFGWILTIYIGLISLPIFAAPLLFNKLRFTYFSRIFLLTVANIIPLFTSVADKFDVPGVLEDLQYYHMRLVLISISVFPFILFQLREWPGWIFGLILNFACLIFFDPIHEWFGVGFYQLGLTSPNYYFFNYITVLVFGILTGSSYFLKSSFEKSDSENTVLIRELNEATEVIEKQRKLLSVENKQLNEELIEKNSQLNEMNSELIDQNNDLLQFSYSVSHNLRGPVASLLGLVHLAQRETVTDEMRILMDHINKSAESLDMTIKDLNSIIELKNTIAKERQLVFLPVEIEHVKVMLRREIEDHQALVETDFVAGEIVYSVKPMVSSILYNLISNAIKYRDPVRLPKVKISTHKQEGFLRIDIADNGLGIDTDKFKEKLFGMYKRFHTHIEGKGLGLFLVKLQAESLGGKIEVQSTLGLGTTFSVYIKAAEPENFAV